ncbi:hypothetical protein LB505_009665 [Fusarium chuoi]|nr:hypothetical protein LB505_009665 [Fusarium chuoi]
MSMLATASPSPHPSSFGMPRPWETNRCPDYSLRPRTENDKVALPSIRQGQPWAHHHCPQRLLNIYTHPILAKEGGYQWSVKLKWRESAKYHACATVRIEALHPDRFHHAYLSKGDHRRIGPLPQGQALF